MMKIMMVLGNQDAGEKESAWRCEDEDGSNTCTLCHRE